MVKKEEKYRSVEARSMLALKKFESLKIPASCYGLWQDHASSVDSLKYSLAVYSSCDLSDKDWRQSL